MVNFRNTSRNVLLAGMLAIGACTLVPMAASAAEAKATLSGASEVPPTASSATGTLQASITNDVLTWTVTYSGLSGPVTGAHFHGPAMAGANAAVVVPFTGSLASPIKGTATLTAAQMADLMAGKWYVNLHTAASPGGEIRGQVMVTP